MKGNNWSVYLHKNKINGEVYVGITSREPSVRWNNGKGYPSKKFKDDIQKYGWDNFEHCIINTGLTEKEARKIETELIQKYDTTEEEKGYNIRTGGQDARVHLRFPKGMTDKIKKAALEKGYKSTTEYIIKLLKKDGVKEY